jgi:hypothetical protein
MGLFRKISENAKIKTTEFLHYSLFIIHYSLFNFTFSVLHRAGKLIRQELITGY